MATELQRTAVVNLHESDTREGAASVIDNYPGEEVGDTTYDIAQPVTKTKTDAGDDVVAFGDPYELYHAKNATI